MKGKHYLISILTGVALLGGVSTAVAASSPVNDPQVPKGVAAVAAAVCDHPVNATNASGQLKTVTSSDARFYISTAWTNLECGQLTVSVPRGKAAGLKVSSDAEVTCTGPTPDQTQWCLGRVLVSGAEAYPTAPEASGSFAWAQSSPDVGAWESNEFTRSMTLRCPASTATQAPCNWNVQVQVRNHVDGLNFRVDDSTVATELLYY